MRHYRKLRRKSKFNEVVLSCPSRAISYLGCTFRMGCVYSDGAQGIAIPVHRSFQRNASSGGYCPRKRDCHPTFGTSLSSSQEVYRWTAKGSFKHLPNVPLQAESSICGKPWTPIPENFSVRLRKQQPTWQEKEQDPCEPKQHSCL